MIWVRSSWLPYLPYRSSNLNTNSAEVLKNRIKYTGIVRFSLIRHRMADKFALLWMEMKHAWNPSPDFLSKTYGHLSRGTVDPFDVVTNSCYFLYPFSEKIWRQAKRFAAVAESVGFGAQEEFCHCIFSCLLACFGFISIQGLIT